MSQLAHYQFAEGVSTITLDDGKVNAMSIAMQEAVHAALDQAERNGGVVVLAGNNKLFSAGFDLKVFQTGGEELRKMLRGGMELSQRLIEFPTPIVAAATGHAMAMGFFLVLSCDYRVGTNTDAKFCANEVAIGLTVPYYAVELCRQALAPNSLFRAINLAETFSGQDAIAAGILDVTVAQNNVVTTALDKAKALRQLNLKAYKATKDRAKAHIYTALNRALAADVEAWHSR